MLLQTLEIKNAFKALAWGETIAAKSAIEELVKETIDMCIY